MREWNTIFDSCAVPLMCSATSPFATINDHTIPQFSSDRINLNSLFHSTKMYCIYGEKENGRKGTKRNKEIICALDRVLCNNTYLLCVRHSLSLWISMHELIHLMFDFRHVSHGVVFNGNRPLSRPMTNEWVWNVVSMQWTQRDNSY